jgi:dolichol kinase
VLYSLTTTSLLETELQLFSIAMINVLIMARSPQIIILRALLWIGGVGLFISCGFVLRWLAMLERIPKWRFKRAENLQKGMKGKPKSVLMAPFVRVRGLLSRAWKAIEDSEDEPGVLIKQDNFSPKAGNEVDVSSDKDNGTAVPAIAEEVGPQPGIEKNPKPLTRLGSIGRKFKPSKTTPSGRRKRSASASMQGFLGLTETQATLRRWAYAAYAYACIVLIILVVIREYVQRYALRDIEPVGWALSYLFGNLQWFRMQVLLYGLDSWIPLPDHTTPVPVTPFHGAWIEELRQNFGLANTRLFVSAYFATVITFGISIVVFVHMVDVDTRRKVFHFTMVAMLLPCTYIDPVYVAFALSLMLAIFLLLDLFRAAQLPPLAKPLRAFLAPYVDGRDLRGPVVVSHVFLLIGCAIPLWLSMAATGRDETGWDVPVRDVSMLSGVICVGLGDAAASLVGRRFGRHKWIWPGGKSIEGTVAFALAVGVATLAAKCWLRLGGWTDGGGAGDAFVLTLLKAGFAAGTASMTEAVLTGGNDNVIVPIVFWVCVKGLKI